MKKNDYFRELLHNIVISKFTKFDLIDFSLIVAPGCTPISGSQSCPCGREAEVAGEFRCHYQ